MTDERQTSTAATSPTDGDSTSDDTASQSAAALADRPADETAADETPPQVEEAPQAASEPVTEPVSEPVAEPVAEPAAEPAAEATVEPAAAEAGTDAEATAEPTQPAAEASADPGLAGDSPAEEPAASAESAAEPQAPAQEPAEEPVQAASAEEPAAVEVVVATASEQVEPPATEADTGEPAAAEPTAEPTAEAAAEASTATEPPASEAKAAEPAATEAVTETSAAAEPPGEEAKAAEPAATEAVIETSAAAEPPGEEAKPGGPAVAEAGAEKPAAEQAGAPKPAAAAAQAEQAAKEEKEEPAELDDPELLALREAKESGAVVQGRVIGWNRGGFHVVIGEITAFCPSSEMELGRPRSPNTYLDRDLDFKVVKFQRRGRRVVLSRAETLKAHRDEILAALAPGKVVKGVVSSLPDFGAFVDLGGIEGLVHVSEISRSRIKNPKEALKLGQEVEVKVLKIEDGGERISLSMKELEPDPWKGVADKYPRGSEFTGKILRAADFGLFVELEPDVEGLIHVSQLAPGQDMKDEALQPGQEVKGWVREVDSKRGRISLSLREVPDDDPWKTATQRFPEGEMAEGVVESIAPFGVFINLAPGLTGLLPNSQTGLPRGTSPARVYTPGNKVEVQVLTIDTRRKRISLGKQGSRIEATKADLQEYRKQVRQDEKEAPGAMAAAFARLRGDTDDEG